MAVRSRRSTPGRRPLSSHSWSSSWAGTDCDDLVQVIGGKGRARGEFMNPQGVTLTYKGDILVTDSNNQCVQVGPEAWQGLRLMLMFSDVQQHRGPHI